MAKRAAAKKQDEAIDPTPTPERLTAAYGAITRLHTQIVAMTAAGKTVLAKGFVEDLLDRERRVCVMDPTGAWSGLRLSADGTEAAYPVIVLGGDHGDAELPYYAGEAVAAFVARRDAPPIVLDTSHMRRGDNLTPGSVDFDEYAYFCRDFLRELYRLNSATLYLVIDEADASAPQTPTKAEQPMLRAYDEIIRRGRKKGFRVTSITQRPAVMNNNVLTQATTFVILRLIGTSDQDAVERWLARNAPEHRATIMESLPTLNTGEAWVAAPAEGLVDRIQFPMNRTYDSSRSPDPDDEDITFPALADRADLTDLLAGLAPPAADEAAGAAPAASAPKKGKGRANGAKSPERRAEGQGGASRARQASEAVSGAPDAAEARQAGYREGYAAGRASAEEDRADALASAREEGRKAGYAAGEADGEARGARRERERWAERLAALAREAGTDASPAARPNSVAPTAEPASEATPDAKAAPAPTKPTPAPSSAKVPAAPPADPAASSGETAPATGGTPTGEDGLTTLARTLRGELARLYPLRVTWTQLAMAAGKKAKGPQFAKAKRVLVDSGTVTQEGDVVSLTVPPEGAGGRSFAQAALSHLPAVARDVLARLLEEDGQRADDVAAADARVASGPQWNTALRVLTQNDLVHEHDGILRLGDAARGVPAAGKADPSEGSVVRPAPARGEDGGEPARASAADLADLSSMAQLFVTKLAEIHPRRLTLPQLAAACGRKSSGGSYNKAKGKLLASGLLDNQDGRYGLRTPPADAGDRSYLNAMRDALPTSAVDVLNAVLDGPGRAPADVAEGLGRVARGGSWNAIMAELKAAELVELRSGQLFPHPSLDHAA